MATFEAAYDIYDEVASMFCDFLADRLKVALREKGVRHDLIDAVFALGNEDDLVRLVRRVEALQAFLKTDDGANLLVGYRRAANILKIEEKKDKREYRDAPDTAALSQAEEKALHDALLSAQESVAKLLAREDFAGAMAEMAKLRAPVDRFFDKVTVNADDKNAAREPSEAAWRRSSPPRTRSPTSRKSKANRTVFQGESRKGAQVGGVYGLRSTLSTASTIAR